MRFAENPTWDIDASTARQSAWLPDRRLHCLDHPAQRRHRPSPRRSRTPAATDTGAQPSRHPGRPPHSHPARPPWTCGEPVAAKAARRVREAVRENGPVERPEPRPGPTSQRSPAAPHTRPSRSPTTTPPPHQNRDSKRPTTRTARWATPRVSAGRRGCAAFWAPTRWFAGRRAGKLHRQDHSTQRWKHAQPRPAAARRRACGCREP